MTETNDYEKAKQGCWESSPYDMEQEAFNYVFNRAYQLGKEHAESDRDAKILKTHLKVEHYFSEKRIQLAGMAMQGILSNPVWMQNIFAAVQTEANGDDKLSGEMMKDEILSNAIEVADVLLDRLK